jgi:hypothetical protein
MMEAARTSETLVKFLPDYMVLQPRRQQSSCNLKDHQQMAALSLAERRYRGGQNRPITCSSLAIQHKENLKSKKFLDLLCNHQFFKKDLFHIVT